MTTTDPIGFAGVGNMGAPMVRQLAAKGRPVRILDRDPAALEALAGVEGVSAAASPADLCAGVHTVILILPDGDVVRRVVLGEDGAPGLAGHLARGSLLIDMSTSFPPGTTALAGELAAKGLRLIDAPVSGGVRRAVSGDLTIMAGGAAADVDEAEPILGAMGTVFRTGAIGSGHAMKLLNNYLSASGLAAACEAVVIGRRLGLDPDRMAEVFNCSTGRSNATDLKLKQQVNNLRFDTGFTLGLMAKDLRLGAALARELDMRADGLEACEALYGRGGRELGAAADHTEIYRLIAMMAGEDDPRP